MITPVELLLSLRYLRARTRTRFVSFISVASTAGIALGVAALITVIAVMNGFSGELRDNLLSLNAHATVRASDPRQSLPDWLSLRGTLLGEAGVLAVTPYLEGEGMLVAGSRLRPVRVDGVFLQAPTVRETLEERLLRGGLAPLEGGDDAVLIGAGLAALLGVDVGGRVNLLVPDHGRGGLVSPVLNRLTVAGVFEAGIQEHDTGRIILGSELAASILGRPDAVADGLRVVLDDLMRAPAFAERWQASLAPGLRVTDWSTQQASYFRAVRMEKMMMFLILSLIVAVAAFNIVATLVMVVNDKRTDIAILRTMGLAPTSVTTVFVVQGVLIGFIGVLAGLSGGLLLTQHLDSVLPWLESALHIRLIPTDVYYLDHIPTDLRWREVVVIALTAFMLASVATVYPARQAARTQPADALRYE
jgi:lipoprotein-releasing system permease protein